MTKIAIVFHSGFGHTKAVAERVQKGAAGVPGVQATLISVAELPSAEGKPAGGRWAELDAADAIIFGTPTYMGDVSAEFKRFAEATSGQWFQQKWRDKVAAGFTNSGGLSGDKSGTLLSLVTLASQHSMIWISQGVMSSEYTGDGRGLNRLGAWVGLMTQSEGQKSPDQTPGEPDRATAEAFGRRVAEAAARWVKGR